MLAVVQAQHLFFGSEPRDIEAQQRQREEEDFKAAALFRFAVAMMTVGCGFVAIDSPCHEVKDAAEHHAANGNR